VQRVATAGEKPDFWLVSKNNTGSFPLRSNPAGKKTRNQKHRSKQNNANWQIFKFSLSRCFLPVRCCEAANCRYKIYSKANNEVFRSTGATRCTDSRQTWHGRRTCVRMAVQNFTSIGAGRWNPAPKY